jgi:hypothetical protein
VLGGLVAELEYLGAGGVGFEESMVEYRGEILGRGEGMSGEGCGVEVFGSVRKRIGDGQRVQKLTPFGESGRRRVTFYHTEVRTG